MLRNQVATERSTSELQRLVSAGHGCQWKKGPRWNARSICLRSWGVPRYIMFLNAEVWNTNLIEYFIRFSYKLQQKDLAQRSMTLLTVWRGSGQLVSTCWFGTLTSFVWARKKSRIFLRCWHFLGSFLSRPAWPWHPSAKFVRHAAVWAAGRGGEMNSAADKTLHFLAFWSQWLVTSQWIVLAIGQLPGFMAKESIRLWFVSYVSTT